MAADEEEDDDDDHLRRATDPNPNPNPSLRSQMAPLFLVVLRSSGGGDEADALIKRFELPADTETKREVELTLDALDEIANVTATQMNDDSLGLHLALRLPRGSYGLLEYIGRSAATVRDAGERFLRYSALLNDTVMFTFVRHPDGTTATITQRVPGRRSCVGRHPGEMFAGLLVRYLREISGTDFQPVAVGFAHDKPADTSELDAFFRAPIAFGCGENRVELPLDVLELPLLGADPALFSILEEQAERLLASAQPTEAVADASSNKEEDETDKGKGKDQEIDRLAKIRERIRLALEDGQPQLEDVAAALNMSARTLQRRLSDAETTFLELVDDVRHGLALAYIANPKFALGEVAYLLGFSEISAFTRAFKRWTGMTPSRWRARSNDLA